MRQLDSVWNLLISVNTDLESRLRDIEQRLRNMEDHLKNIEKAVNPSGPSSIITAGQLLDIVYILEGTNE